MRQSSPQVSGFRCGVVVKKVDQFSTRRFQGGVALGGGLPASRDENFELVGRIIQGAAGRYGFDFRLLWPRGNQNRDPRHFVIHLTKLKAEGRRAKVKVEERKRLNPPQFCIS